jgi:hypothetical protein
MKDNSECTIEAQISDDIDELCLKYLDTQVSIKFCVALIFYGTLGALNRGVCLHFIDEFVKKAMESAKDIYKEVQNEKD